MRTELIEDLLNHLDKDGSLQIGNADNRTTHALEALAIPMDLRRLLQWNWTTGGGEVGPYTLHSVNEVTSHSDFDALFARRMVPIGFAANGDILVVRIDEEDCRVGLVSHDRFWEGECGPEEAYVEVAPTVEEYLWRSVEGRYLPRDYYAANELADLRTEINGCGDQASSSVST